ncbi:LysR family transcriptional regulator [Bowmanella denitrificans]|uniref:LysR family transcriptional regulator n=1 Tax=Bowmanella denitrificans TaxID=366582 RepID=UPI000C9A5858|nr:LysR family transcriptional regulator [Bowmanella denitrificans]
MLGLDTIRTFVLVAECLNFSAAARQLQLPRATVSARIQELERRLGVRLLRRNTRNMSLTHEGGQYLIACQQALSTLQTAEDKLRNDGQLRGSIRLSLPALLPDSSLLRQLAAFCHLNSEVSVELVVDDAPLDFIEHRIDLAIRGGHPVKDNLVARELASYPIILVVNKLQARQWSDPLPSNMLLDPLARMKPALRSPRLHCQDLGYALQLCLNGTAPALLPEPLCRTHLQSGELVQLPSPFPLPDLPLYLVYEPRSQLSQAAQALIDWLLSAKD